VNGFEHSAALGTEAKNAFQAKEYTRAVELFSQAIRHDSENIDFYADRAVCLSVLGRYEDALRDGERCVELRPDWPRGYARRGLSEFCLGAYESAAESYRQGLQLAPYDSELEQGLRKALDMARQTDEENADGLREPEKASVNGQKKASVKCSDEDGLSEMSDDARRSRAQTLPQVQTNEGCLLEKQEEMGPTKSLPLKGKVPSRLRAFNRQMSLGKSA
jgi:tetratricopeptide (TPR) repeat protein